MPNRFIRRAKLALPAFAAVIILLICPACPEGGGTPHNLTLSVTPSRGTVTTGHSLRLIARVGDVIDPTNWRVTWSTTYGSITNSGSRVTYTAPQTTGWALVTVTATDGTHTLTHTIPLMVFRQFVMLKVDDIGYTNAAFTPGEGWARFFDLIETKQIKCAAGIITSCLESPDPDLLQQLLTLRDGGRVEFFHHGYDHSAGPLNRWFEFRGTPYDSQLQHLRRGIELGQDRLGITFESFGAPFNKIDDLTRQALAQCPEIRVWLYGLPNPNQIVVRRNAEIESSPARPSFDYFLAHYPTDNEYIALQLHPGQYADAQFVELEKAIDYLIAESSSFITPIEYCRLKQNGTFPLKQGQDSDSDGKPDTVEGDGDSNENGVPDFLDPDTP